MRIRNDADDEAAVQYVNGYICEWSLQRPDVFFFCDAMYRRDDEKSASESFEAAGAQLSNEIEKIRKRLELGEIDVSKSKLQMGQALRSIFQYASGPLMNDY